MIVVKHPCGAVRAYREDRIIEFLCAIELSPEPLDCERECNLLQKLLDSGEART